MGAEGSEMYLPQRIDVKMLFNFIGNNIGADYTALYTYKDIKLSGSLPETLPRKRDYNLSDLYRLSVNTDTTNTHIANMDTQRPIPLTGIEKRLYDVFAEREEYRRNTPPEPKSKSRVFWGEVGDMLISDYTFRFNDLTSVKFYPLLNPLQLRYSHSN